MKVNLKSDKGITLLELIITMAISTIVIIGIYSLLQFGYNVYNKGTDQFAAQSDGRLATDQVIQEIKYASEVTIMTDLAAEAEMATTDYDYIMIKDELIYLSSVDGTTGVRASNKTLATTINGLPSFFAKIAGKGDSLLLHFEFEEDDEDFGLDNMVKLINIGLQSTTTEVLGINSGKAIKFKTPLRSEVLTVSPIVNPIAVNDVHVRGTDEITGGTTDVITAPEGVLIMKATITPTNATDHSVSWEVLTTDVATVNTSTGLLTARGNGIVEVFATANDGSGVVGSTIITVSGQALPLGITNNTSISVTKGTTYTYKPEGEGGQEPYTFEYIIQSGSNGSYSIAADNSEITWDAPSGVGKSLFFKVVIKDAFDVTRSYDITLTSVN